MNLTREPLNLRFLRTGCGACTEVWLRERRLQPGDVFQLAPNERHVVKLVVNVPRKAGQHVLAAFFAVDQPGQPAAQEAILRCNVQVYDNCSFDPVTISHETKPGEDKEATKAIKLVHVYRATGRRSLVLQVGRLPRRLRLVATERTGQPQRLEDQLWRETWTLTFAVQPGAGTPEGSSFGSVPIAFHTENGKLVSEGQLPVVIHERYGIEFPKSVYFGTVAAGERRCKRLMIRAADEQPFDVLQVTSDCSAFQAACRRGASGIHHWLDIEFTPDVEGEFTGTVPVQTDHPDCRQFKVAAAAYAGRIKPADRPGK